MRPYQLVVWGATGFTGRLVCEHIANDYQGKLRWAIAGRSQAKLDALKADLVSINPACKDIPLLIADAAVQETVDEVASKTDVLLTTAGPYARFGMPVVQACAEKGTHYCDLTGEPHFVRASIRQFDAKAKETGAKIIHSCGYDSIPSDLTTLETVRFAREQFGKPPDEVALLQTMYGGASGGTIDSALGFLTQDSEARKQVDAPYCLDPPGSLYASGQGPDSPPSLWPTWSEAAQSWTAPFIMSQANEPVVRRTNALLGYLYGEGFRFSERMPASNYLVGLGSSAAFVLLGAFVFAASQLSFLRKLLPASGEGPSKQMQTSGYWKAASYGLIKQAGSSGPRRVLTVLQDRNRDPGYWSTSRMILEASLVLIMDQDALAKDEAASTAPAGVLTPAAALGHVLTRRLLNAGYTLDNKVL